MSDWLHEIIYGWEWTGVAPTEIIDVNAFGNVIFADKNRKYWRIVPENLELVTIAESDELYSVLRASPDFQEDWKMENLVNAALEMIGKPKDDCCYCLKVPAILGGKYVRENIGTISISELIRTSGFLARQIDGLPDGAPVEIIVTD